jgi:hypothetical protein
MYGPRVGTVYFQLHVVTTGSYGNADYIDVLQNGTH